MAFPRKVSGSDLFKWKKKEQLYPSQQKKSNVQDWIKRVQDASADAVRDAYGGVIPGMGNFDEMHPDDESVYEAQLLLDTWMKDQKLGDLNCELDFAEEKWSSKTKPILNSTKYLDYYGTDDLASYTLNEVGTVLKKADLVKDQNRKGYGTDDYLCTNTVLDEDLGDDCIVQDILQDMMGKSVIKEDFLTDLGMDQITVNFADPTPKMEQRHKLVKDRSQARREKIQKNRKEDMMKKEAHHSAKQIVMKEEKARRHKTVIEEQAIQHDMARIRKEMEEERKRNREEQERKTKIIKEAKEQMYLEERANQEKAEKDERRRQDAEEKMKKAILREIEEKTLTETVNNLKVLNKHFSAWYGVLLEQRVKMGKARAVSDWRCKLRAWNAWKGYVSHVKSNKEAEAIAAVMKEKYRKEQMALKHHRLKVLRQNFVAWQLWVRGEQQRQAAEEDHKKKATKMAAFLQAAATGKLWNKDKTASKDKNDLHSADVTEVRSIPSTARQVDAIFSSKKSKPRNIEKISTTAWQSEQVVSRAKEAWNENMLSPRKVGQKSNLNEENTALIKQPVQVDGNIRPALIKNSDYNTKSKTQTIQNDLNRDNKNAITFSNKKKSTQIVFPSLNQNRLSSEDLRLENIESARTNSTEELQSETAVNSVTRKASIKSTKPVTKPISLAMEERAKQRAERKEINEERKRQQELKRFQELKLKEEKRLMQDLAEKEERIRKKKEEKSLEREREFEKQRRLEQYRHNCVLADDHYSLTLLRKYGMEPWKRLIQIADLNHQISGKYNQRNLLRTILNDWKIYTQNIREEKERLAEECYQRILLKRCFFAFKKYRHHMDKLEIVAKDYFQSCLVKKYFKAWQDFVTDEEILMWSKEQKADEHNEMRTVKTCYSCWRRFCVLSKEDKIHQKRKDELRKKVRGWLPDFQGDNPASPSNSVT